MKVSITYDDTLYKLVPKEATPEMLSEWLWAAGHHYDRRKVWACLLSAAPTPPAQPAEQTKSVAQWKSGNEFLPFHPQASHVNPDYRDGWNACYTAAQPAERMPLTDEQRHGLWKKWVMSPCEDDWHGRREAERLEAAYKDGLRDAETSHGITEQKP